MECRLQEVGSKTERERGRGSELVFIKLLCTHAHVVYLWVLFREGGGMKGGREGEENDVQNLVKFCISLLPSIQKLLSCT